MKKELELYAWLLRGSQRTAVLRALDSEMTPKLLAETTKLKFSNVSDVLRDMRKLGLAVCLNPKAKTGRLYRLTPEGLKLRKRLK